MRALFATVTGGGVRWEDRFLDPTPNRAIVIRMLNNLTAGFGRSGDALRLGVTMRLRGSIDELAETERDAIDAATALFN